MTVFAGMLWLMKRWMFSDTSNTTTMTISSIISYNWEPKAAVYIMHSIDDETVPYTNATNAKSKWRNANITYNFGHYGGHVMTCLRFIYSVQTLLIEEEKEMEQYE
mgnify:CR=1 FL=1